MKPHQMRTIVNVAKPPSQRQLRVGEEIRHILSQVFARGLLYNDVIGRHSISVTEVKMTADLKQARTFIMTLGGQELAAVIAELNEHAPQIRSFVAKELSMRYTPRLIFKPDFSFDNADRIHRLLLSPHVAQDLNKDPEPDHNEN